MNVDGVSKTVSLLENNLEACLKSWSNQKILKTLTYLDDAYYNGESLVSDQTYDKMIDYYKEVRKQEYKKIGAPIKGEKVKLPIHMGSMDKVKPGSSDLKNFFVKYTNPKCIMDKLDGTSLLIDLKLCSKFIASSEKLLSLEPSARADAIFPSTFNFIILN